MSAYDFTIVGTGLFGAVFANEAMKHGKKVLMVEKRDHIGGNIYTEKRDGIDIHRYGAHIFHTSDKEVWDYMNSLVAFRPFINSPIASYHGHIYNMPFNMNTFARMWDIATPEEAKKIIEKQRGEITHEPENLEEQAISLVGRDIYETLVREYTEKQWGRKCTELPPWIIKRLPVRFTYDNNYFSDPYQGIPEDGYTAIIERLIDGADVVLAEDYTADKEKWDSKSERTLYTGCLDALYEYRLGKLEYRSEIFREERLEMEDFQGNAVVNYTDRETPWTRIIEHKHFLKTASPVTWISREYPVDYSKTGEPFYPINDERNSGLYKEYRKLAESDNRLLIGGRLADYAYYDMDKTVRAALNLAAKAL